MRAYLKIKIKSLAEESKIIRQEEHRWSKAMKSLEQYAQRIDPESQDTQLRSRYSLAQSTHLGLSLHRRNDVRAESRASLLAYGFLRGRKYAQIEGKCINPPPISRVAELVKKFGPHGRNARHEDMVKEWTEAGP